MPSPIAGRCALCGHRPAKYFMSMNHVVGDRCALPEQLQTCAECQRLLSAHADQELAARLTWEFDDWGRQEVVAHLHRRGGEPHLLAEPPAELAQLREEGYQPLDEMTGVDEDLGPLWPDGHCLEFADPRLRGTDRELRWLARSPWPSITVAEVMQMLWPWVERKPFVQDLWAERVSEVFSWTEAQALAWLETCRHQEH